MKTSTKLIILVLIFIGTYLLSLPRVKNGVVKVEQMVETATTSATSTSTLADHNRSSVFKIMLSRHANTLYERNNLLSRASAHGVVYAPKKTSGNCPLLKPRVGNGAEVISPDELNALYEKYETCLAVQGNILGAMVEAMAQRDPTTKVAYAMGREKEGIFHMHSVGCEVGAKKYWPSADCSRLKEDVELQVASATGFLMQVIDMLATREVISGKAFPEAVGLNLMFIGYQYGQKNLRRILENLPSDPTQEALCTRIIELDWTYKTGVGYGPFNTEEETRVNNLCRPKQ